MDEGKKSTYRIADKRVFAAATMRSAIFALAIVATCAWIVAASSSNSFAQAQPRSSNPKTQAAIDHIHELSRALMNLQWHWMAANRQASAALRSSSAALQSADKCNSAGGSDTKSIRKLIDTAESDYKIADYNTATTRLIEQAILVDAQETVNGLLKENPRAAQDPAFLKLRWNMTRLPSAAMSIRTGVDPGDDPLTGSGILSQTSDNLRAATAALTRCSAAGHASAGEREALAAGGKFK